MAAIGLYGSSTYSMPIVTADSAAVNTVFDANTPVYDQIGKSCRGEERGSERMWVALTISSLPSLSITDAPRQMKGAPDAGAVESSFYCAVSANTIVTATEAQTATATFSMAKTFANCRTTAFLSYATQDGTAIAGIINQRKGMNYDSQYYSQERTIQPQAGVTLTRSKGL